MSVLMVYIDAATERRLDNLAVDLDRPIEELAEAAIAEAALNAFRHRKDDPGAKVKACPTCGAGGDDACRSAQGNRLPRRHVLRAAA
jgi:hypothetical protein